MEEIHTIGTNRRKSSTDIWHIRFDLPAATTAEKLEWRGLTCGGYQSPSFPLPSLSHLLFALPMFHTFPSLLYFSP